MARKKRLKILKQEKKIFFTRRDRTEYYLTVRTATGHKRKCVATIMYRQFGMDADEIKVTWK